MKESILAKIKEQLSAPGRTRVLAFGSSNTERYLYGMHWFDIVHLGVRGKYGGGKSHFINTGISGNTTVELLARFSSDAEFYKPHIVFITIGGNDANPARNVSKEQFRENLIRLNNKFAEMGSIVIFQTYYSPDPKSVEKKHIENFYAYMDIVRETAADAGSGLIDHLARWEQLRTADESRYLAMMLNGFHVNEKGNILLGIDILKSLDIEPVVPVNGNESAVFCEAVENQKFIDNIASK